MNVNTKFKSSLFALGSCLYLTACSSSNGVDEVTVDSVSLRWNNYFTRVQQFLTKNLPPKPIAKAVCKRAAFFVTLLKIIQIMCCGYCIFVI